MAKISKVRLGFIIGGGILVMALNTLIYYMDARELKEKHSYNQTSSQTINRELINLASSAEKKVEDKKEPIGE